MTPLSILVLAAGQGTRMKSELPKVLHPVAGRPMLEHVLRAVMPLKPKGIAAVLGHGRKVVQATLIERGWKALKVVIQATPRGSGHAVLMARSWLKGRSGHLLVVYGDTPLLTTETLRRLTEHHAKSGNAATFLAMEVADPSGYGRMVVDAQGFVQRIVEDKDATPEEKKIRIVNSGVACWKISSLLSALPRLRPNNAKREYYLTDAAAILRSDGGRVGVVIAEDPEETQGINHREDLSKAEAIARYRILKRWMQAGVTIVDPATTYIDDEVQLSADSTIWPGTILQGPSSIAAHCDIGPYSIVESSTVAEHVKIGPFARLRPGTVVDAGARIGNFVEVKKSRIGKGSKVNHLTYIGDASLGQHVNIGAGTITCNYDGFTKSKTLIDDGVFVGSNTNLVAPVKVGRDVIIAAGSTITEDIPAEALALARARQVNKAGWAKTFRKQKAILKGKGHD